VKVSGRAEICKDWVY